MYAYKRRLHRLNLHVGNSPSLDAILQRVGSMLC